MNPDGLDDLEAQICDRLKADPWFSASRLLPGGQYATIPVISEEAGDIDTMIAKAIAELGICVTVAVLEAKTTGTEIGGLTYDPIDIVLLVAENVTLNRSDLGTQKRGKATALYAGTLLSLWTPPALSSPLTCNRDAYKKVSDEGGLVQHNFRLQARGGLSIALPQVAPPVFNVPSGSVADSVNLTCATPGAAIFWTEDGRRPAPRTGNLLTDWIDITTAKTIRARAFLAGFRDSELVEATFTAP